MKTIASCAVGVAEVKIRGGVHTHVAGDIEFMVGSGVADADVARSIDAHTFGAARGNSYSACSRIIKTSTGISPPTN